jgi:hypothetical protein
MTPLLADLSKGLRAMVVVVNCDRLIYSMNVYSHSQNIFQRGNNFLKELAS